MKAHNLLVTGSLTAGSGEVISSISSSVAATTLGLGNRVTTLEGKSATTGSNTFQGLQTINGNLVVTGSLTAQQFIVSSSVTYLTTSFASGSTKFGDTFDDTMQITGSVYITGAVVTMYASLTSTGSDARIYSFSNDAAGSYAGFTAQSTAANGGFHLLSPVSGAMSHVNTVSNYDTYLSTRNANNLILATANTERIRIGGSGGIAVTGSLNVNGNFLVTGSFTSNYATFNNQSNANTTALSINGYSSTVGGHIGQFSNALYLSSNWYYSGGQTSDNIGFGAAAITLQASNTGSLSQINFSLQDPSGSGVSPKMSIFSNGYIGANTTSPTNYLSVNGSFNSTVAASGTGAISPGISEILTTGFNLAPSASQDISFATVSSSSSWRLIVKGGFANNNEGGGLVSPSAEIEVNSSNATISAGSTTITFSRNATTGRLQVTNNSSSFRITFVGIIELIDYPQSVKPTISKTTLGYFGIATTNPQQPLQLGQVSVIAQDANSMYVGANFASSTAGNYIKSQYANQIHFDSALGVINFKVAATGTAGSAISYSTVMTITSANTISKFGGYVWEFMRYSKGFVENTSNVNFFSIQLGTNTSAVITIYLLSDNYGTGAFRQTTYQIGAGFYYGGYRSTTATLTDNRVGPGGDSSIGTVTVSSGGLITVTLSTSTNGTGTTNDTSAYVVVNQNTGNAPTFTQL